jgi:hypothetical protein
MCVGPVPHINVCFHCGAAAEDIVISHGPTAYSKGAGHEHRAWAHRVSIKSMSPAPGIKFSRGSGPQVRAFLL